MKTRNTKEGKDSGRTDRCVPLSQDPDMIRLKELVKKLDPERREQLIADLVDATEQEEQDHAEEAN